jgi:hypothetical protein
LEVYLYLYYEELKENSGKRELKGLLVREEEYFEGFYSCFGRFGI